ncbi:MAG: Gfo/Idh/MocA family oxidoreductase, partial [Planctomycetales bacterium]|nr:Gfo/Idh/MocA family oxidoreductase [Planctomycetales bacterium]
MAAIAHIGYGHWGKNIARNLAELGCLAAVVDTNHKAAENAANSLGARVSTVANVLADPGINAVSIATPAANHFEHAWAALAAGKHVFVEKPLALDIEGAKQLCELANAKGLVLMVGHLLRYHPGFVRLCELVTEEKLGRLLHIRSNRLSLGKIRTEENVLWSFAPHDVSM